MEAAALEVIKADTFTRIEQIENLLLKSDPQLPGHLQAIHKNLIQYEELVHLLDDDQIHKLIRGQTVYTGTVLIKETAGKSKSANTKAAKGIRAEDL